MAGQSPGISFHLSNVFFLQTGLRLNALRYGLMRLSNIERVELIGPIVYIPELRSLFTHAYQFGSFALRSICYPHYPNTRITRCGHTVPHSYALVELACSPFE